MSDEERPLAMRWQSPRGGTLLHIALMKYAPPLLLSLMIARTSTKYLDVVTLRDDGDDAPLHTAAHFCPSLHDVWHLISIYPGGLLACNYSGETSLAVNRALSTNPDCVALLESATTAMQEYDFEGLCEAIDKLGMASPALINLEESWRRVIEFKERIIELEERFGVAA